MTCIPEGGPLYVDATYAPPLHVPHTAEVIAKALRTSQDFVAAIAKGLHDGFGTSGGSWSGGSLDVSGLTASPETASPVLQEQGPIQGTRRNPEKEQLGDCMGLSFNTIALAWQQCQEACSISDVCEVWQFGHKPKGAPKGCFMGVPIQCSTQEAMAYGGKLMPERIMKTAPHGLLRIGIGALLVRRLLRRVATTSIIHLTRPLIEVPATAFGSRNTIWQSGYSTPFMCL